MQTEQPGRDGAFSYYRFQNSIYLFHRQLWDFYNFVKKHCDNIPDIKCGDTPKLVCFRSVRDYPPVQCKLYEAGYFPLTVDHRFAKDVARDSIKPPIRVTEIHANRFKRMWAHVKTFRLKRPPSGPSETIVGV